MTTDINNNDIDSKFHSRIQSAHMTVQAWDDDPTLLAECRAYIPYDALNYSTTATATSEEDNYTRDDDYLYSGDALFLKRLTLYFQKNIMTWVNAPACVKCGENKDMESRGVRGPETAEEIEGGANRVECELLFMLLPINQSINQSIIAVFLHVHYGRLFVSRLFFLTLVFKCIFAQPAKT